MSTFPGANNPAYYVQPPNVPDALADFLRAHYQEQGWRPDRQEDWQHHRRNGMVELAQYLISCNETQRANHGLEPEAVLASDQ